MRYNKNMVAKNRYLIATRFGSFYARIVERKREGIFSVSIPAFSNVMTEGRTLTEAKKFAAEVIELQCHAALDDHKLVIDDLRHAYGKYARAGTFNVSA